jgi:hypothetical protein
MTADQGAREARYAEAIHRHTCGDGECCCWEEDITPCAEVDLTGFVRAFLPVADAEVAAAVSEAQAELSEQLRDARVRLDERTLMCDAADEAAERRLDQSIRWMERAESAEAEVERLRSLVSEDAREARQALLSTLTAMEDMKPRPAPLSDPVIGGPS